MSLTNTLSTKTPAVSAATDAASSQPPAAGTTRFTYGTASVSDLRIRNVQRTETGRVKLQHVDINGITTFATRRFWRSFFTRYGIAENVFRYFSPAEVFDRISGQNAEDIFRYCVANHTDTDGRVGRRLLAVTSVKRPVIRFDEVQHIVTQYGGTDVKYHDGLVTSTHSPRGGAREFAIGGDQFRDRFCLETPVDGYGHPRLFLSMMRMVCSNGMVGYARAFRSDIPVGKHLDHCITRALESFDNGDGYAALRQRFESSQSSWASVHECLQLGSLIEKLQRDRLLLGSGYLSRFRTLSGNLNEFYGMANLESLSDKRRRILPSKARVYDLINFGSELATHHATHDGGNRIQAFIGSLISDEYDLEGTATDNADFDAFFIDSSDSIVRQSRN